MFRKLWGLQKSNQCIRQDAKNAQIKVWSLRFDIKKTGCLSQAG